MVQDIYVKNASFPQIYIDFYFEQSVTRALTRGHRSVVIKLYGERLVFWSSIYLSSDYLFYKLDYDVKCQDLRLRFQFFIGSWYMDTRVTTFWQRYRASSKLDSHTVG